MKFITLTDSIILNMDRIILVKKVKKNTDVYGKDNWLVEVAFDAGAYARTGYLFESEVEAVCDSWLQNFLLRCRSEDFGGRISHK